MNKHKRMQTQRQKLTDIKHSQANRKNRRKHARKPTQYFTNILHPHKQKKTAKHTYKHSHTHANTHPQEQYLTHRQAQKHSQTLTLSEEEIC